MDSLKTLPAAATKQEEILPEADPEKASEEDPGDKLNHPSCSDDPKGGCQLVVSGPEQDPTIVVEVND